MTFTDKKLVLERIKVANWSSPIIVFRSKLSPTRLDSYFANTVESKRMVKTRAGELIGIFTRDDIDKFKKLTATFE